MMQEKKSLCPINNIQKNIDHLHISQAFIRNLKPACKLSTYAYQDTNAFRLKWDKGISKYMHEILK